MSHYNREEEYVPREPYKLRFTAEDVRQVRDSKQVGMMTAKDILVREQILNDIQRGRRSLDVALLYDLLEFMIQDGIIRKIG